MEPLNIAAEITREAKKATLLAFYSPLLEALPFLLFIFARVSTQSHLLVYVLIQYFGLLAGDPII